MSDKTYIYLISNIEYNPNKVYVGKTNNYNNRKYSHLKKYGNKIKFSIIDEVDSIKSIEWKPLECYWIEQFRQWGFQLMNKNNGGGGADRKTLKSIEATINKLKKPIIQYTKNGLPVKEWESAKQIKKELGFRISSCLRKRYKTSGGFIWKYKKDKNPDFSFNNSPSKGNTVYQFDKDGNFIKKWTSTLEAEYYFTTKTKDNIGACCRKKQKSAYNYIWSYSQELDIHYYINNKNKKLLGFGSHKKRKIGQYNMNHELIKIWDSIQEASLQYNIKPDNINKCCNNKQKQTKNFIWKYIN